MAVEPASNTLADHVQSITNHITTGGSAHEAYTPLYTPLTPNVNCTRENVRNSRAKARTGGGVVALSTSALTCIKCKHGLHSCPILLPSINVPKPL